MTEAALISHLHPGLGNPFDLTLAQFMGVIIRRCEVMTLIHGESSDPVVRNRARVERTKLLREHG